MIYTENTKKAIQIMFDNQKEQIDKGNTPYIFHPWHVAENMPDETRTIVALLHDVVEDTNITIKDLEKEQFSKDVIKALKLLTHKKEEDYETYIKKISRNAIAIDVKLADLRHNSDLNRLEAPTKEDYKRVEKYQECIKVLETAKQELNSSSKK